MSTKPEYIFLQQIEQTARLNVLDHIKQAWIYSDVMWNQI